MKRSFFVVLVCLFLSQAAWAQKFTVPEIPQDIKKSEYVNYQQDFLDCLNWLETHSPSAAQREDAYAYVLWWLTGTPDLKISISSDVANFNNGDLLLLYLGGCARYCIQNDITESNVDSNVAAAEVVINYYLKYKDSIGKVKAVEDFIKMRDKGTLRDHIGKSIRE